YQIVDSIFPSFGENSGRIHDNLSRVCYRRGDISQLLKFIFFRLLKAKIYSKNIVHFNLTSMLSVHGLFHCITILLRYIQIAYETSMIYSPSPGCSPRPIITILRITSYTSIVLLMGGIIVERSLATYFVIDYEKRKRSMISISLLLVIYTLSYFLSNGIVEG
ncbi:hypothetical protein PFISCL1PPCAC_7319, partial [Pristionchus fissidentatus]